MDTLGIKEGPTVVCTIELKYILLLLDLFEAWPHVIVVDLELQYLLIAYSVGDDILM